jgi:hypothetical protein
MHLFRAEFTKLLARGQASSVAEALLPLDLLIDCAKAFSSGRVDHFHERNVSLEV